MAGDWIKMRDCLWDDPRVVRLALALNVPRATVCGALFRTWALADQYTVDGRLAGYTGETLDVAVGLGGWSRALEAIGWLKVQADAVVIPRFLEHNGQSAKRRAMERDRKQAARNVSASDADKKRPREEGEKRREREEFGV